eukprot:IDg19000t1
MHGTAMRSGAWRRATRLCDCRVTCRYAHAHAHASAHDLRVALWYVSYIRYGMRKRAASACLLCVCNAWTRATRAEKRAALTCSVRVPQLRHARRRNVECVYLLLHLAADFQKLAQHCRKTACATDALSACT